MTDEPKVGVVRVNVHADGTRDVEEVGPEHPVIGALAALVEAELRTQIAGGKLGVPPLRIDVAALPQNAFSVAEEVDTTSYSRSGTALRAAVLMPRSRLRWPRITTATSRCRSSTSYSCRCTRTS